MEKINKLFLFSLVLLIMALACDKASCELSDEDKKYLYENGNEIRFLENGTDTVFSKAKTYFHIYDETSATGLPDLAKQESGSSTLLFNDHFSLGIHRIACWESIRFSLYQIIKTNKLLFSETMAINTVVSTPITILGKEYSNYFQLTVNDSLKILKTLYYAKEIGVIKIEFSDGYTLELLP